MCSPPMMSLKSTHNEGAAKIESLKKNDKGEIRPSKPQHSTNTPNSENADQKCQKFPSCIRNMPASSAEDIRCRFLNRLGIQKVAPNLLKNSLSSYPKASLLREPLKDNTVETSDDDSVCTDTSSTSSLRNNKLRRVSFDDSVTVCPIPKRDAYSDRIKQQIWSDRRELYQNAARNSIEFAAENWDWRQAVGDEDMILTERGRIHPIHYARQCNMQRNFLLVMAARQQCK